MSNTTALQSDMETEEESYSQSSQTIDSSKRKAEGYPEGEKPTKKPKLKRELSEYDLEELKATKYLKLCHFSDEDFKEIKKQLEDQSEEVNFMNRNVPSFKKYEVREIPSNRVKIFLSEEEKKERARISRRKYSQKEEVQKLRKQKTQSEEYKAKQKELQKNPEYLEKKKKADQIQRKAIKYIKNEKRDLFNEYKARALMELEKKVE